MLRFLPQLLPLMVFVGMCTESLHAQQWGDLTGQFIYDGTPPTASPVTVTKDIEVCGKHMLVNESLVVGPDGGLANVVVYLYLGLGDTKPEVHSSYAESEKAEVALDNDKCRFAPHIALLRTSQTLVIGNKDAVGHNTKIDTFANAPINPIIPAGGQLSQQFPAEERLPVPVSCSIHPWMQAYLVVKEHPYIAASDASGKFVIKNLPAGTWTFQAWQEKAGYVSDVTLNGSPTEWSRGRFEITIEPGVNDLGEIKVAASAFQN